MSKGVSFTKADLVYGLLLLGIFFCEGRFSRLHHGAYDRLPLPKIFPIYSSSKQVIDRRPDSLEYLTLCKEVLYQSLYRRLQRSV